MGFKDLDNEYDFVVKAYENEESYNKAKKLTLDSDIVIIGSTTDELIEERLKQDKITFRYRSRVFLFANGFFKTIFDKKELKLFYQRHIKYRKNKNLYILCANAYGANDFELLRLYTNKKYKWGYLQDVQLLQIEKWVQYRS